MTEDVFEKKRNFIDCIPSFSKLPIFMTFVLYHFLRGSFIGIRTFMERWDKPEKLENYGSVVEDLES